VHRIGRDSVYIEHTGASVFGTIQPDKLAQLSGLESDGLLQRFAPIRASISSDRQSPGYVARLEDPTSIRGTARP
jgi:hypothetical protein